MEYMATFTAPEGINTVVTALQGDVTLANIWAMIGQFAPIVTVLVLLGISYTIYRRVIRKASHMKA